MSTLSRILRYTWAAPATMVGLSLGAMAACAGATFRVSDGVIEIGGGRLGALLRFPPRMLRFQAITFGHVVLGRSHALLSQVRCHEQVHVRQYERWGIFFFPVYVGSSLWQFLVGRDPYLDNCFEREAFRVAEASSRDSRADT